MRATRTSNLQKQGFWKKKSLGQNFLVNPRILDKIAEAAEITHTDIVIEIGPGTGTLTERLAEKAEKIIAVEKDHRLIPELKEKFKNTNVEIIEGDILRLDVRKLFENYKLKIENSHYKVVGNIPYYITSRFIRTVFESWPRPEIIVLTIQKEVAKRIIAKPPKMNLLAVSVQLYADPKIVGRLSRKNFRPAPKVDSAIIKLIPKHMAWGREQTEQFFKIARASFSGKRKQLVNSLSSSLKIPREKIITLLMRLDIDPRSRPETLKIEDWIRLCRKMDID